MNTINIYIRSVWTKLQKLFKSGGEGFLLVGKVSVLILLVLVQVDNVTAQSKVIVKPVEQLDLHELKKFEVMPDAVQDMPLEFQYFNGKPNVTTSFRALKENFVQLFFWDTSYSEHYTDLKKIYDYKEEMSVFSTFFLVISKSDKATLDQVMTTCARFKREFLVDMDIACVIGNSNLDKLFKVPVFPKYVQINKDAVFVDEITVDNVFKNLDRSKSNGK